LEQERQLVLPKYCQKNLPEHCFSGEIKPVLCSAMALPFLPGNNFTDPTVGSELLKFFSHRLREIVTCVFF
jgi:hypothetical protein